MVNANRVSIVILAVIPLVFALQKLGDVQGIVLEQAKFIASFFFVPIVVGLNWRRGTAKGAVAAMIGGFTACLIWTLFFQEHYFPLYGIDSVEVGVGISLLLFVIVSRMTKPHPKQNLSVFFARDSARE